MLRTAPKRVLASLLVIFLIASVMVIELMSRLLLPRPGFYPFPKHQPPGLLEPHPTRFYTYASDFSARVVTEEYNITVKTNSWRLRDDPILPNETPEILAIGDSFTVGFGVEQKEAWPAQLENVLNRSRRQPVRVVNAGVSGYSLAQIRILAEELLDRLEPRLVVLGLYSSRYWRIENPYVYWDGILVSRDRLPQITPMPGGFYHSPFETPRLRSADFYLGEKFYFGAHLLRAARSARRAWRRGGDAPHEPGSLTTRQEMGPLLVELQRIHRTVSDRGSQLAVLLIAHQSRGETFAAEDREATALAEDFCTGLGVPVFDPLPRLESFADGGPSLRIGEDHHWNRDAHRLAAAGLGGFLEEQGVLEKPAPGTTSADAAEDEEQLPQPRQQAERGAHQDELQLVLLETRP